MHVAHLLLDIFELALCPHHVVQQVPNFRFNEVLVQAITVSNLSLQHEFIVIER